MTSGVLDQLRTMRQSIAASLRKDPRYLTIEALDKSIYEIATVLHGPESKVSDLASELRHPGERATRPPELEKIVWDQIAGDNIKLRERFLAEVPTFRVDEIPGAREWIETGEIFAVDDSGIDRFPTFQISHDRPHPSVKKALDALPSRMTSWQKAFWFVSANGWLDDLAPMERLDEIERISDAARHESEELVG